MAQMNGPNKAQQMNGPNRAPTNEWAQGPANRAQQMHPLEWAQQGPLFKLSTSYGAVA